jgi:hypothetical protein
MDPSLNSTPAHRQPLSEKPPVLPLFFNSVSGGAPVTVELDEQATLDDLAALIGADQDGNDHSNCACE